MKRCAPLLLLTFLTIWILTPPVDALLLDTCQGVDDTAAIQAAIDAHPEVVIAADSICVVTVGTAKYALRIAKSRFRLALESGAVIRLADGSVSGLEQGFLVQVGDLVSPHSDVRITGPGTLDGNRLQNPLDKGMTRRALVRVVGPVSDVEIAGLRLVGSGGDAILLQGDPDANASHIRIHDNFLFDNGEGITFKWADYVSVRGNHISETAVQDGIEPHEGSDHWVLADNLIEQTTLNQGAAINPFAGAANGLIIGNVVRGHATGFDLERASAVSMIGNELSKPGPPYTGKGIIVKENGSASPLVIQGNRIRGYLTGIQVSDGDVSIRKNTIVESGGAAILWNAGDDGQIESNVLENANQLDINGRALQVNQTSKLEIVGNRIHDDPGGPASAAGAFFKLGVSGVRFAANEISVDPAPAVVDLSQGGVSYSRNVGVWSEGQGSAVISSPSRFVDVAHGLDVPPAPSGISITPTNDLGEASQFWISDVGQASFRIHVDADPGAAGASFVWSVRAE